MDSNILEHDLHNHSVDWMLRGTKGYQTASLCQNVPKTNHFPCQRHTLFHMMTEYLFQQNEAECLNTISNAVNRYQLCLF